eukprot:3125649-Amphidinium_carterae.1
MYWHGQVRSQERHRALRTFCSHMLPCAGSTHQAPGIPCIIAWTSSSHVTPGASPLGLEPKGCGRHGSASTSAYAHD